MIARAPLQNDLEILLVEAGLSAAAVEVLLNLALGPARESDLRYNTKLLEEESATVALAELRHRGLLAEAVLGDGRFDLGTPEAMIRALGQPAGDRLSWLVERVRQEHVSGVSPNPGLPAPDSLAPPFAARRAALVGRSPQVEVRVHTVCNLGCVYCFIRRDSADSLGFADARRALARAAESGIRRLILTGGEPTIRRDLPQLITAARELGFVDVQLFTNGLMFAYAGLVDACVAAGLTSLVLHVSTFDPDVYARIAGRDMLPHVHAAMDNLSRHPSLAVEVISVINRLTLDGLQDTIRHTRDWQRRSGFRWFANQIPFCCVYSSSWDNRDRVLLPLEESLSVVNRIIDADGDSPWPLLFLGYPLCLLPGRESQVFDLYLTLARVLMPQREFDYTFLDTMFVKPARCRDCRLEACCVGLSRGYARVFGTGLVSPDRNAP